MSDYVRERMESYWRAAAVKAEEFKDPYIIFEAMRGIYLSFDAAERTAANRVLIEWAVSDDDSRQFIGLALIDEFRVQEAVPSLQALAERLAKTRTPSAPFDLEKVRRIISDLGGDS